MFIRKTRISLASLGIYRGLLQDPVISKLSGLLEYIESCPEDTIGTLSRYNEFYHILMKKGEGCSLKDYIILKVLYHDNVYARFVQKSRGIEISHPIKSAAKNDLNALYQIASITSEHIKEGANLVGIHISEWDTQNRRGINEDHQWMISLFQTSHDWGDCIDDLGLFHQRHGSGIWSEFKGFIWEGEKLEGVVSLDPIRLDELIGYEIERQKVVNNTLAFLQGYPANNVLLYGSRGTGKSSTVKALLNEYDTEGLRIIEISKRHLATFPKVIRKIKDYPQKFILFIDDLSFEEHDGAYTALKAVLEGGLETRPQNVVIYATSNRRHFIKEKFSDRTGILSGNQDDEVRAMDTMQEKLSLADRFGITVTFTSPNQKQYLEIVDGLVKSREIQIEGEELHRKAIQWEMWYNARSPRTAKQFVDWLEGSL